MGVDDFYDGRRGVVPSDDFNAVIGDGFHQASVLIKAKEELTVSPSASCMAIHDWSSMVRLDGKYDARLPELILRAHLDAFRRAVPGAPSMDTEPMVVQMRSGARLVRAK